MRKSIVLLSVVASVFFSVVGASACGDKLLHLSRIHRRHPVGETAVVLVFSRPGSLLSNAASLRLEPTFQHEGYHVVFVNTEGELAAAIQSRASDTVIADVADVPTVQSLALRSPLAIIPVIPKGAVPADSRHYGAVVKFPAKAGKFVDAVEDVLDSRASERNGLKTVSHSLP